MTTWYRSVVFLPAEPDWDTLEVSFIYNII